MSALLDNIINGNRSDAREILRTRNNRRTAMLDVINLIEDLIDTGSSPLNAIDNVRSLVEAM